MKPLPLTLIIVAALAIGGAAIISQMGGANSFAKLQPLPVIKFLGKPTSYNGNTFVVDVRVADQLGHEDGIGFLWSVRPADPEGDGPPLPIFVPESLEMNIQPDQRYRLKVEIKEGLCNVVEISKF